MNVATREIIRLALANDRSVPPEVAEGIDRILDGESQPTSDGNGPLLLTMTDAAKMLGVSRSTLWRLVKEKVLEPVEITPRVFRVSRKSVEEVAARCSKYKPVRRGPRLKTNCKEAIRGTAVQASAEENR